MKAQHIPGLAIGVVDGDHVVWQQAFGHTDGSGSRPVTVDTMFSAQSMSKLFTATTVEAITPRAGRARRLPHQTVSPSKPTPRVRRDPETAQ